MKSIEAKSCERAWLDAARFLLSRPRQEEHNLMIEISQPATRSPEDREIYSALDKFLRKHKAQPIITVAETIFPAGEYQSHGKKGVYEVYPNQIYPVIKDAGDWGRYAYRLVRRRAKDGEGAFNPLKDVIAKMRAQIKNGRRMRACYELGTFDPSYDLPLYDAATDAGRTRGGPCLSHISLKMGRDRKLYLTALYRLHYYITRALGNFKGLASLQAFICNETGLSPGPLVCVSTLATIDTVSCSVTQARKLVIGIKK